MKKLYGILLITAIASLAACATFSKTYSGNCVSEALFAGHVMMKNGYETRVVVMRTENPDVLYAQAQARIHEQWVWLECDPAQVYEGRQEYAEIIETLSPDEFWKRISR